MEEAKIVKITNVKQFECLVQCMEQNVEVAKGYFNFGSSKADYFNAWNRFADKLNSLGPPVRDGPGWQKVWNDFKGKIKKKLGHNKKEIEKTGGGPCRLYTFSPLEESVISLLCYDKIYSKPNKNTFGLSSVPGPSKESIANNSLINNTQSTNYIVTELNIEPLPADDTKMSELIESNMETISSPSSTSEKNIQKKHQNKTKTTFNEERHRLLEIQTKSIQEIEKYAKESARYARKTYKLKRKKFKIWHQKQLDKIKLRSDLKCTACNEEVVMASDM